MPNLRILLASLLVAAPLVSQIPLEVAVAPGAPAFDFYGWGPYRESVPRPDSLLGHAIGTRQTMYHQQWAVLDAMAAAAPDRARFEISGRSAEGKMMRLLIISSPANLARLEAIQSDLTALADPRVTDGSRAAEIVAGTPAVAFLSHSIHGNEPAGFEAAMMTAYTLLASESAQVKMLLDSLVVIINPSQNPDGHERFAAWSNSVALGLSAREALEQSEPWTIQGRFNHYRFDINRDLIAQSQPETRATAQAVLRWRPQLFVDLHSTTPQYFFPPAAQPVNAHLPASAVEWLERFGLGNAAAFDERGWLYYVRDVFDLYYPGYWDTWPSLLGATGMTFETDGGPELAIEKSDGSVTTFREGIAHHVVASTATLTTLATHRSARLTDYRKFFESAMTRPTGNFRRVIIGPGTDPVRTHEVMALLAGQGVEVTRLSSSFSTSATSYLTGLNERQSFGDGHYVIDLAQPQGHLATALLEPQSLLDSAFARRQLDRFERNRRRGENTPREGYEFYDVTAWALPLTHGLDAWYSGDTGPVSGEPVQPDQRIGVQLPTLQQARSGYLIRPGSRNAQAMVLELLREGFTAGVASSPLRADGIQYPAGTVVFRTVRNADSLHRRISQLMSKHLTVATGVGTAFADSGQVGIGSEAVQSLRTPSILVAAGDGVSQTAFGDVWWYLEHELHQPFTPVDTRRIAGLDLDRYNVIILPSGSYASTLGTAGLNRLRDWVRGGGALIALEGAVSLLEHKELGLRTAVEAAKDADSLTVADTLLSVTAAPGPFTSPSAVGNREAMWVPGAIARASMDPTHWLRWGYRDDALAVMLPDEFLPASRTGENVVIFDEASEVLAGFTWPGNTDVHLPGTVWATVEGFGRGSVIAFAGNPLFRGFWRGPAMLFTNAIMFGSGR